MRFWIDEHSREIMTDGPMNREAVPSYKFEVRVSERYFCMKLYESKGNNVSVYEGMED